MKFYSLHTVITVQRPRKKYADFVKQQPGRARQNSFKQEQEEISHNHVHTFSGGPVQSLKMSHEKNTWETE